MKAHESELNPSSEAYDPDMMEDDEEWNEFDTEYENDTYIKHIRQDVGILKTYCTVKVMAEAIGGAFTADFVEGICKEDGETVPHFMRNGNMYIAIDPFLEKLKAGLTFEDAPTQSH